jgi:hypothetical protein
VQPDKDLQNRARDHVNVYIIFGDLGVMESENTWINIFQCREV